MIKNITYKKPNSKLKIREKLALIFLPFFFLVSLGLGFLFLGQSGNTDAAQYPSEYCVRDDYYVQLTDQDQFGNCWTFANAKALENWLAINTGEHFEISETYISLEREEKEMIGNGGSIINFQNSIYQNGFVLDVDFPYQDAYYANTENNELLYSIYSSDADKYTLKFGEQDIKVANYRANTSILKYYITKYGCATININNWSLYDNSNIRKEEIEIEKGGNGGHSLVVLGWDDYYPANNGTRGAYIILNSHGDYENQGVVYLPYTLSPYFSEKKDLTVSAFSFDITLPDDYVFLNSNANYQINSKGRYYYSTNYLASSTTLKEKNIFDVDADFTLEYTFPNKDNLDYEIDVFKGDKEVTSQFSIIKDENVCRVLRKGRLESGTYKLKLNYSYNQNNRKIQRNILKELFLLDGLELKAVRRQLSDREGLNESVVFDSLAMPDENIHIYDFKLSILESSLNLDFVFAPFSSWTSYSLKQGSREIAGKTYTGFSPSRYILNIKIPSSELKVSQNKFTITFANQKHSKTYNLIVDRDLKDSYNTVNKGNSRVSSYLKINLNGGSLPENYDKKVMFTLQNDSAFRRYYLNNPYKDGYKFQEYKYYEASSGTWKTLNHDSANNKYYLTYENINKAQGENYFTMHYGEFNFKNYILLNATYIQDYNPIQTHVAGIVNDTFDYTQSITARLNSENATNVVWTLDGEEKSILQNFVLGNLKPGSYVLAVEFRKDGVLYNYKQDVYVKRHVYQVFADKTKFVYNGQIQKPTIKIDGLIEGVDYSLTYSNSVNVGEYSVKIKRLKPVELDAYDFKYSIEKLSLELTFENIVIKQYENLREIKFQQKGWIEDEEIKIEFDMSKVDTSVVGEYIVPFTITNLTPSYELVYDDPAVVVIPTDFKVEDISLLTTKISAQKTNIFNFGERFKIQLDCPVKMIKNVNYELNGKTYKNKIHYVTDRLPVGNYTIKANVELFENQAFEVTEFSREFDIEIKPTKVKVVVESKKGYQGELPRNLTYSFVCDYEVSGLDVTLQLKDFDKDVLGDYVVTANVSGKDYSNYIVEIVDGTYTVVKKPLSTLAIVFIVFGGIIGLMILILIAKAIYKRRH